MPNQAITDPYYHTDLRCKWTWRTYGEGDTDDAFFAARLLLEGCRNSPLLDEHRAGLHMLLSRSDDSASFHGHKATLIYAGLVADARRNGHAARVAHFRALLEQAWAWMNEAREREAWETENSE